MTMASWGAAVGIIVPRDSPADGKLNCINGFCRQPVCALELPTLSLQANSRFFTRLVTMAFHLPHYIPHEAG
jgi:hypothetical protein